MLLNMPIDSLINSLLSYYLAAYVYFKAQHTTMNKKQGIYLILTGFLLSTVSVYVRIQSISISHFILFLIAPLFLSLISWEKGEFVKSLAIGFIAYGFVIICETISTFIIGIILWMFFRTSNEHIANILIDISTILLCFFFMRIKRFKRGFQFFNTDKNMGLGLSISSIILILRSIDLQDKKNEDFHLVVYIIGCTIAGYGLYLWIRRSITAHQRERMQLKSEEHYQEVLKERDKEIKKQRQSNEYLAKVVHRDNHLMNSLNTAINAYYNTDDNVEKSDLFREIQTMIKERGELIDREQRETKLLPSTGSLLIDSTINDLFIKAAAHGIDFDMAASAPVSEIIGKYISQTDLQTLLSDHIKDAVIAVEARGEGSGKILLDLSMQNDNYCITIYDNGVAFEPDTLSKLGMERVTTHAESGGSGIGFMTTFETLNKAYASLIITEFDSTMPFTKSVAFRFDGESSFIIQSHRSEELKEKLTRDDVVIL